MAKKLSVIIPSRNEPYLIKTVEDVLANSTCPIQVVAILDGGDWPVGWAEAVAQAQGKLVTIRYADSRGMRNAINAGVGASEGWDYIMKSDAHCSFAHGFDAVLMSDCGERTVMVPRRFRLDVNTWSTLMDERPPVDYEYLSFPEDKNKAMGGRVWNERASARADLLLDPTPTFQGSCWVMQKRYFHELKLMDEKTYGGFFHEAQEICLKAWLSGGQVLVNKRTAYSHWHKPKEVGRGYTLEAGLREQAVDGVRRWLTGKGWRKQTLPFSSLLERFPGMPGWPEQWQEAL